MEYEVKEIGLKGHRPQIFIMGCRNWIVLYWKSVHFVCEFSACGHLHEGHRLNPLFFLLQEQITRTVVSNATRRCSQHSLYGDLEKSRMPY